MGPTITLSDELFARAQRLAVPLVDTLESVISKGFDALEAAGGSGSIGQNMKSATIASEAGITVYNPAAPPNLAFSQPQAIKLCGIRFAHGQLYWNTLMLDVIHRAADLLQDRQSLLQLMIVPSIAGKKEEHGYKYLQRLDISIQGQDANGAWRQAYHIVNELGLTVEVVWRWQNTEKAALPGQKGSFSVAGTR